MTPLATGHHNLTVWPEVVATLLRPGPPPFLNVQRTVASLDTRPASLRVTDSTSRRSLQPSDYHTWIEKEWSPLCTNAMTPRSCLRGDRKAYGI